MNELPAEWDEDLKDQTGTRECIATEPIGCDLVRLNRAQSRATVVEIDSLKTLAERTGSWLARRLLFELRGLAVKLVGD